MPMFEDTMELAQSGELPPKDSASPRSRLSCPIERTGTPSMPINIPTSPHRSRRISEVSIRTELCEGPIFNCPSPLPQTFVPHSPLAASAQCTTAVSHPQHTPPDWNACEQHANHTDLIEWIKCGESPAWASNQDLTSIRHYQSPTRSSRPASAGTPKTTSALLPPADITPEQVSRKHHDQNMESSTIRSEDGINIERPRSALHRGDFTHGTSTGDSPRPQSLLKDDTEVRTARLARPSTQISPEIDASPWLATSPPWNHAPFSFDCRPPATSLVESRLFRSSGPSPSSSASSGFVYKPPTSPLVMFQSNNDEDEASDTTLTNNVDVALNDNSTDVSRNVHSSPRRHTVALSHYRSLPSSPYPTPTSHSLFLQSPGHAHRKSALPCQAHQPRRSISSKNYNVDHLVSLGSVSSPQTPIPSRFRRPSFTINTSPLQNTSLVGSYEESILRGRMSTTPSKPLDFLAQIAVLGLGTKCKPSLRCPAHVTLPFSAVFYSYATTSYGRSKPDDGPSPYVGMVDLENGLPNPCADQRSKRKAALPSRRTALQARASQAMELKSDKVGRSDDSEAPALDAIPIEEDIAMEDMQVEHFNLSAAEAQKPAITAPRSHKRQSHGLKAPPGGSYRIPEQGQLQIIIKNQNKTAVKLFLVPYNLTGMEPGKKTFIRQRSYSAGSVIDNIPVANGTSSDRAVLRYLIHLHICCPSRGRYYLYKSIRVVFANRVPDGKENLRNELSFPEPRYSPYKPVRAMPPPPSLPGAAGSHAALATEKAYRRRSSGFAFTSHGVSQGFDAFGITHPPIPVATPSSNLSKSASSASLQPWSQQTAVASPGSEQAAKTVIRAREFKKTLDFKKLINIEHFPERHLEGEESSGNCSQGSAVHKPNSLQPKELGDGKTDYVDIAFSTEGDHASCEGLLSQRLRTLEVKKTPSID